MNDVSEQAMFIYLVLLFEIAGCLTPIQQEYLYDLPEDILNGIIQNNEKSARGLVDYSIEPDMLDYGSKSYIPDYNSNNVEADGSLLNILGIAPINTDELSSLAADTQAQPSMRDTELLQHSSLWGSQLVTGGAGEGKQHLSPSGSFANTVNSKSDSSLPAYCEPPNPCPFHYTEADGCLETFENTASFSRSYQQQEQCICDYEHMFTCAMSTKNSDVSALARELDHTGVWKDEVTPLLKITRARVVAKKFKNCIHKKKENPYLIGEKHSIAAKKG